MSDPFLPGSQAPILVVGAGAVGGYLAAHLQRIGQPVALLEPWAPNREAIASRGLTIEEPSGSFTARLPTSGSPRDLAGPQPSLVILCTKLADAPANIGAIEAFHHGPYLATLNALADLELAERLGQDRVMGCIVTGLFAHLIGPGHVRRHKHRLQGGPATFRLGEASGPPTPRLRALVDLLGQIDGAEMVEDLTKARWTKLVFNCMTSPLSALHGRPIRGLFLDPDLRSELVQVALEVVAVAAASGVQVDAICGIPGTVWHLAARRDAASLASLHAGLVRYGRMLNPDAISGMAQDHARGRRTEVDLINGAVVRRARKLGLDAPGNAGLVTRLEAGTASRVL
jgi:2-dehydropantoate 2-reductase